MGLDAEVVLSALNNLNGLPLSLSLSRSNKVPPRPAGQRTEPEPAQGFPGFGFGDNFHMSFGIGAFPFGFFTSSFNFGEPRPAGE